MKNHHTIPASHYPQWILDQVSSADGEENDARLPASFSSPDQGQELNKHSSISDADIVFSFARIFSILLSSMVTTPDEDADPIGPSGSGMPSEFQQKI